MNSLLNKRPLMILGTSSGAGKSLMTTAICRILLRKGEIPLPFKGQNMSNNAWVDNEGGEMAYSQALQAWASGVEPSCAMNPILLKPKGDCTSEVIHLGKCVGTTQAKTYYENWFESGWIAIQNGLKRLKSLNSKGRFVIEGAGSPVEINLQHKDLTNLKLAKYLNADCILVADIERGGVFAQIIGTLELLSSRERKLIKGIIINRFRGDISLFDKGRDWIEKKTNIPILGVMPWLNEIFPPEDSLDLLGRNKAKNTAEIEIAIIKLPYISNFSDIDPLEAEPSVDLSWIEPGNLLGEPDAVIIPGSKETLKDLKTISESDLADQLKAYAARGGSILGICGGLQIMGETIEDPLEGENLRDKFSKTIKGLGLLPIKTRFSSKKKLRRREIVSCWPEKVTISGYELHYGVSEKIDKSENSVSSFFNDSSLGWIKKNISGIYIHGIFDNSRWRRLWLNKLRVKKGLSCLKINIPNHEEHKEYLINKLADQFKEHINLDLILKHE